MLVISLAEAGEKGAWDGVGGWMQSACSHQIVQARNAYESQGKTANISAHRPANLDSDFKGELQYGANVNKCSNNTHPVAQSECAQCL